MTDDTGPAQTAVRIDVDRIALTIDQALAPHTAPPTYEELAHLEQLLRGHIQLLLPIMQEHTNRMDRGRPAWEQRQATLDSVRRLLIEGPGGLLSASAHVHELARGCRFLLDHYQAQTGG